MLNVLITNNLSRSLMTDTRMTLLEAIARRRRVTALYNGTTLDLAPHLMFERHGDLFVSALNINKKWRSDEEPRLGNFKLIGLAEAAVLDEEFEPLPSFVPKPPHDDAILVLAV